VPDDEEIKIRSAPSTLQTPAAKRRKGDLPPRQEEVLDDLPQTIPVPPDEGPHGPHAANFDETLIEVMLDIEVPLCEIERQTTAIYNVSVDRKRRVEVCERKLSDKDRALFREAKRLELQSWLEHKVFEIVARKGVDMRRAMRARWVLTWKAVGKAKARLCVLGFQDPDLTEMERDSPTMSTQAESLMLQWIASSGYVIESGDIKTAFLSGDHDDREVFILPPPDVAKMLHMSDQEILRLRKAVYGLVNAPRKWWERLRKSLLTLGFVQSQLDPCIFIMKSANKTHGMLGVHVDDILGAGDRVYQAAIAKLREEFQFGSWDTHKMKFRGRNIVQKQDGEIIVDMKHYMQNELTPIEVTKSDRATPERPLTDKEMTKYRGGLGSIGWLVDHCCPIVAYELSVLRRKGSEATVMDMLKLNKLIRKVQVMPCEIRIRPIPLNDTIFVGVSDAAHANNDNGFSQEGHVILAAHRNITKDKVPVSIMSWTSRRIKRVVRSSLAAETSSCASMIETLDWMRTVWAEMVVPNFEMDDYEKNLQMNPAIAVTDCKSLYDSLKKEGAAPSSSDKRLAIELALVRQKLQDGETHIRWIDARFQIADCLTKNASRTSEAILHRLILESIWRLTAEDTQLEVRERERAARLSRKMEVESDSEADR